MDEIILNKKIDERIRKIVPDILGGSSFSGRTLTDTPTDALSVVPRKYVTMNGSVAGRPINSVTAQFYFNNDTNTPMWRGTDGKFHNGVGSIVA